MKDDPWPQQLIWNDFIKRGKLQLLLLDDGIPVNYSKGTRWKHVKLDMKWGNGKVFFFFSNDNIVYFKVNIKNDGKLV